MQVSDCEAECHPLKFWESFAAFFIEQLLQVDNLLRWDIEYFPQAVSPIAHKLLSKSKCSPISWHEQEKEVIAIAKLWKIPSCFVLIYLFIYLWGFLAELGQNFSFLHKHKPNQNWITFQRNGASFFKVFLWLPDSRWHLVSLCLYIAGKILVVELYP